MPERCIKCGHPMLLFSDEKGWYETCADETCGYKLYVYLFKAQPKEEAKPC